VPQQVLTSDQLTTLQKADSPTIANVIELFNVRSCVAGYSNRTLRAIYPELPPAVGYAVTLTFRASYPAESGDSYGGMPQIIADSMPTPEPRMVVFQDLDDPPQAATYGEVMAASFQRFGFAGLITSGAARDVEQVRKLRFPCWASSVIVSHGYFQFPDFNVPVTVGGLQIKPGDLLHADANGVVKIPHAIAPAVAEFCEPFMEAERIALDYLQTPKPTVEGYREAMARFRRRTAELREKAQAAIKTQP
jgi:4-hydroxy-4-methyl-2-oxoglutarate aldolase